MTYLRSSHSSFLSLFWVLVLFIGSPKEVGATCHGANGVLDFNCDGLVQVTVLGDSLVSGVGDTKNRNRGGYVRRSELRLRQVAFANLGIPGATTSSWLRGLNVIFRTNRDPRRRSVLRQSDIIVIDLGRNDRWERSPRAAFANLRSLVAFLKREIARTEGRPPYVVVSVLMLPNRGSQGPWVKEFNALVARSHSSGFYADLRFDRVSKRLLQKDQIHPTPAGYDAITRVFLQYITRTASSRMRALMPDADGDGISNYYELNKFSTDPMLADTDGDGYSDFDELFRRNTNPLDPTSY